MAANPAFEDKLAKSRHFTQILTDKLKNHFARSANEDADRILFMAYQANK